MGFLDRARKLAEQANGIRAEFEQRRGSAQPPASAPYTPSPMPGGEDKIRAACSQVGVPCPADLLDMQVLASILGEPVSGPELRWEEWEGPHAVWGTTTQPGVHIDVKCGAPDPDEGEQVNAEWADAYFTLGDRPAWFARTEPLDIQRVDWAKVTWRDSGGSVALRRGSLILEIEVDGQQGDDSRRSTTAVTQAIADSLSTQAHPTGAAPA